MAGLTICGKLLLDAKSRVWLVGYMWGPVQERCLVVCPDNLGEKKNIDDYSGVDGWCVLWGAWYGVTRSPEALL